MEVVSCGGSLSKTNRNCLVGDDAHRIFREIRADILFFSSKALAPDGVIYDCYREEVCVRNTMLDHAAKKVFLCASEKIGNYAGYRQGSLEDVDLLITEKEDPEVFRGLDLRGVETV